MDRKKKIIIAVVIIVILLIILGIILLLNNKTYTVNFDTKGGTSVESQSVKKNGVATEPENPIKEGYIFLGWYLSEESTTKYDFGTKVTEDITLIAKWGVAEEENKVTEITITSGKTEITVNEELSLSAKVMAGDEELEETELIWTSSDEKIATVDKNGKVKALKAGKVTITVSANGVTSKIEITVKEETTKTNANTSSSSTKNTTNNNNTNSNTTNNNTTNNNTTNNNTTNNNTETKVTYTYQWEKVETSVAGQYMLYIVSSEGKKVSGTATLTTIAGTQTTVTIPASGYMCVKDAFSSVTNINVAN